MASKRSLNIVIDVRPLIGGKVSGVEVYIHHLLENLLKLDQENNYFLYTNSFAKVSASLLAYQKKNVTIVQTSIPNKLLNVGIFLFGRPLLDKLLTKKLSTNFLIDIFFQPDVRPTALSKGIKKINVVHDLSFHHYPECFSWKTRLWYKIMNPKKQLKQSDHIIAVSEFTKQDLIATYHVPPEKITVIYEGVDSNFGSNITNEKNAHVRKKYGLPEHYFLFLATLEPRKNMERLIKAFQKYKQNHPTSDIKLVMAGVANPEIFSKYKIQPEADIILTGFIEEEDKAALYTMATAFIYPSLFEGFGLPLVEAMKCQTPLITSDRSSMPEIVKDAALLVNPLDIEAITKALHDIQQPELKTKLKTTMAERIKHFDWKKCAEETHQLILSLAYNREQK